MLVNQTSPPSAMTLAPQYPDAIASSDPVKELRDLLGHDVLLLPWPRGSKGGKRKWGHLTIAAMSDPAYLEELQLGNIGVALGQKSGGICTIDIDADDQVEPFLAANPRLASTLRTHAWRGCNLWIRV